MGRRVPERHVSGEVNVNAVAQRYSTVSIQISIAAGAVPLRSSGLREC